MKPGYLFELFTSIQGEGLWSGRLHHFFRLAGCGVGCRYCDTVAARETGGGTPVSPSDAVDRVADLDARRPGASALAVTGGEPLEQEGFLADFLPLVRSRVLAGRPVLLETAGLHDEAMQRLAPVVDMVSMDIKLPGLSGVHDAWPRHERFLKALEGSSFYVKVVVNEEVRTADVAQAARLVARIDPAAPFFVQPETREGVIRGGGYLLALHRAAGEHLRDVRVQPQWHRLLDLR
jgi:organic radical activating enzyme